MIEANPTPAARSRQRAEPRGFTLVELLIVVGIIGIMAGVAFPDLAAYARASRIRNAQSDVASALQRARNVAIMKNTQMGVSFVVENTKTYWVHVEDTIAGFAGAGESVGFTRQALNILVPNVVLSTRYVLPQDVEFALNAPDCPGVLGFAGVQASVRFDQYGVSTLPGLDADADPLVVTGGATSPLIHIAAGERTVCLIDRRTLLHRWLRISPGGRIARSS